MKILALSKNYGEVTQPVNLSLMADSSLLKSGKPFYIPDFAESFTCHSHLVLHVGRLGKNIAPKFAHRYIDAITAGFTITANNLTDGTPHCDINTAFDGSVLLGDFINIDNSTQLYNASYKAFCSGETIASFSASQLVMDINQIIAYLSKYFAFKIGDLIFTGFGDEPLTLTPGLALEAEVNGQHVLRTLIK